MYVRKHEIRIQNMKKKSTIFAFLFHINSNILFLVDLKCQIESKSRKEKKGDLVERSAPLSMSFYQSTIKCRVSIKIRG